MASPPCPSMAYRPRAPPPSELTKEIREAYALLGALFALLCYGFFSILIGLDVWRAFRKRAIWLPGKAFALTGVTVQIIVWWTTLGKLFKNLNVEVDEAVLYIVGHQIVVSGRVAVCVFVGYLLPEMTAPGVRAFLTLETAVCLQIVSELVFFSEKKRYKRLYDSELKDFLNWAAMVDTIILICTIALGLILGCTVLAIKNIQGLLRQRISSVLPIWEEDECQSSDMSWKDFEDEVLRSWIVARVCRPDYVIARSVLSSTVGIIVTICVILSILSNTFYNIIFEKWNDPVISIFVPLFSFIIVGWVFISWRWLAVRLYFRPQGQSWRRHLYMEDFWTSNTVALIHMNDLKRDRQTFQDNERPSSIMSRSLSKLKSLPAKMFRKVGLPKLLSLLLMLQQGVVFLSKVCGLLSYYIVGKHVYWCRRHLRKGDQVEQPKKYARILKCICLPGEDPSDLWEANKMALEKVDCLIEKGREKGRLSREINSIFNPCSSKWAEDGTELLSMLKKISHPSVPEHFPIVQIQSLQMTVVSLITIFIRLHKAKSDRLGKALKACVEVWDLLTFADDFHIDIHANEISLLRDFNRGKVEVCIAAEREFYKRHIEYNKLSSGCEDCVTNRTEALSILQGLSKRCEDLLRGENLPGDTKKEVSTNLSDCKDWTETALSYTLYKLCKLMLDEDIQDFVEWTEESLRNIIACSMSMLPDMFVKQCWKWAQEFEEDKLWEVSHLAGKCSGMMKAWELKPKPIINPTKEWTMQVI